MMVFVWTEKPAQGQGPQEPDSVQHADAPEERQAKGEVRFWRSSAVKKNPVLADFLQSASSSGLHTREERSQFEITSPHLCWQLLMLLERLQFDPKFVSFQGSNAPAEEVPKAVWCPSEVGPEVSGIDFIHGSELQWEVD